MDLDHGENRQRGGSDDERTVKIMGKKTKIA